MHKEVIALPSNDDDYSDGGGGGGDVDNFDCYIILCFRFGAPSSVKR
jgi:hypothetical protein